MAEPFPHNWKILPLSDCMETIIDYRGKTPRKTSIGVPLITAKIVKGGRILEVQEYIAPEDYDEWMQRGLPHKGDVLITTEAPLGEIAQLDGRKVALAQRLITLRGKPGFLDSNFLKFLMQSPFVQEQLRARGSGTTVTGIRQSELRQVKLTVPPFDEQQTIAWVLGALDDKIDSNRQMNHTLETMAQTLFNSWFVDFDPVTAKAAGRAPFGMTSETAGLFPNRFVESALGLIPEGWQTSKLGDLIELTPGRSYASNELRDSTTALVTLKSFYRGGGYRHDGLKPYVGSYKEEQIVKNGELVVACTDGTQAAEVIGRVAIVFSNPRYSTLVASLDVRIVRPRLAATTQFFYHLMRSTDYVNHVLGHTNGTTVLHLSKEGVPTFKFACPSERLINLFSTVAESIFARIETNVRESGTLAELRDAVLPKLLSGEIRVRQAEKGVAEVI